MRLDDLDPSRHTRDLGRGGSGGGGGLGMVLSLLPLLMGRRLGCGAIIVIGIVGFFLFTGGGLQFADFGGAPSATGSRAASGKTACDTEAELFACRVLTSTEQSWASLFEGAGSRYRPPTLYFYDDHNRSGCGVAQAAMGPFYCPADEGIYLDTDFFAELEQRLGAGGDFAQAYVIAHEVGHHIQHLTGIAEQVRRAQSRAGEAEGNELQVRMELQADCYAGVWAARNRDRLEPGDIEEGMRAAHAIGDDTLMRRAGRAPVESMFTHGTSEQRMTWLGRGLETGDPAACDTFAG